MVDNRLPPILQVAAPPPRDVIAWLSFEDWLGTREHRSSEWVRVHRHLDRGDTQLDTYSALVYVIDNGTIAKVLSSFEWDVFTEFGKPEFVSYHGKLPIYDSGLSEEREGLVFHPFVFERSFHGYAPAVVELDPEFIRFHNLFLVAEADEFRRVTDDGEIVTVVRLSRSENDSFIDLEAYHLRDYLAAKRCALIRYHDHLRWAVPDIKDSIGGDFTKKEVREADRTFELWLRRDLRFDHNRSSSRLLGKDVVMPLDKLDDRHTSWATRKEARKHIGFIVSRDENGREIECTCDESKLSNYFTDRGTPHFLTAVYFKPDVLLRYYSEPTRFSAGPHGVSCLDLWSMPTDESPDGLIQVWLGDLSKLPYKEQEHWRHYNVPPTGSMSKERFQRDFMAQPIDDRRDIAVNLQNAHYATNRRALAKYGHQLFLDLDDRDAHLHKTLRIPVTNEWAEFDEQVQAMAKLIVDSLNVPLLGKISGRSQSVAKGSLNLLEFALEKEGVTPAVRESIMKPLRGLQGLRSAGAAHRKGSKFDNELSRLGIQDKENRAKARNLMGAVVCALESLRDTLPAIKGA